tara:strand:+ start:641 stop:1012 length:372 start_codon:yes stop_codon:yes gene_type:complete
MKFEIIENNAEHVTVRVTVSKRVLASDPNIRIDSIDVAEFLAEEKISIAGVVKETKVDNYSVIPRLTGEWTFRKPVVNKPKKKRKVDAPTSTITEAPKPTVSRRRRKKPAAKEDKLLGTENLE